MWRTRRAALQVSFDYTFDRLLQSKLAQLYAILVFGLERLTGGGRTKESQVEDGGHLRPNVLGTATEHAKTHSLEVPTEWTSRDSITRVQYPLSTLQEMRYRTRVQGSLPAGG
ncbi:MAG: hypothetical protein ACLPV8_05715 [Steroidobacteraceae bacterium]